MTSPYFTGILKDKKVLNNLSDKTF